MQSIILDMDETLGTSLDLDELHKISHNFSNVKHCTTLRLQLADENGSLHPFYFMIRPHLTEFLEYCRRRFNRVIIWSAGHEDYVNTVMEGIQKYCKFKPDAIYTFNHCNSYNNHVTKPLYKIYNDFPDVNPAICFLLEDRKEAFAFTDAQNGLMINKFCIEDVHTDYVKRMDNELVRIMTFLNLDYVQNCHDVRSIKKIEKFNFDRVLPKKLVNFIRNAKFPDEKCCFFRALSAGARSSEPLQLTFRNSINAMCVNDENYKTVYLKEMETRKSKEIVNSDILRLFYRAASNQYVGTVIDLCEAKPIADFFGDACLVSIKIVEPRYCRTVYDRLTPDALDAFTLVWIQNRGFYFCRSPSEHLICNFN